MHIVGIVDFYPVLLIAHDEVLFLFGVGGWSNVFDILRDAQVGVLIGWVLEWVGDG